MIFTCTRQVVKTILVHTYAKTTKNTIIPGVS